MLSNAGSVCAGLLLLGMVSGCLGVQPQNPQQAECLALLRDLDRATDAAGCRHGAYRHDAEFPWLRSSRFWSTFDASAEGEPHDFWLGRLEQLDAESRETERACLAPAVTPSMERLAGCREALRPLALAEPERLRAALQVPDEYSLLRRSLGLYPLVRLGVDWGAHNAYSDRREWFRRDLRDFTGQGEWRALGPAAGVPPASEQVAALLRQAAANPLAVPLPDEEALRQLVEHFAPVVIQQQGGEIDRLGAPRWQGERIVIDTAEPTAYYYADHLRYRGEPRLRLNYVFWYPQRGGEKTPWIEAGDLDGVTIGLVLDGDGSILAAEAMNNCGCYHMFFPGPKLGPQRPLPFAADPLAPQPLPQLASGRRFGLYLLAGWHQPVRAAAVEAPAERYRLRPYRELERLPRPDGTVRSLFDAGGVVPQSVRNGERLLFFSMGIERVGAMRQRGRQPITLVGREHYDEPDLLERNFLPR